MRAGRFTLVSLGLMGCLAGCSGGDGDSGDPTVAPPQTQVPNVNGAAPIPGPLQQAGSSNFSRYVKNGLYANSVITTENSATPPSAPTLAADSRSGFSVTNTQEVGVDEADRIEYDGQTLYVAAYPQWYHSEPEEAGVRVLDRNADGSLSALENLSLSNPERQINGIYLSESQLSVISADFAAIPVDTLIAEPWRPNDAKVTLHLFSASSADRSLQTELEIDGYLLSSRRIGNQLYLATTFVPEVSELSQGASSDEEKLANYNRIFATPMADLMPKLYVDGIGAPMNQASDCFMPAQASSADGFAQIVTITRINVTNPQDRDSLCLSAVADLLYVSPQNAYLTSSFDGRC